MEKEILIRLTDIEMLRENKVILKDVNLDINRGDFLALTGPNGGGKTTLLRIILKLLKPTSGSVTYNTETYLSVGYLPQKNMIDSHFPITVEEVVSLGLYGKQSLTKNDIHKAVNEVLELVGMESYAKHSLGRLSGGQLQRALLARAIISHP